MGEKEPGLKFYIAFAVGFVLLGLVFFGSCESRDSGGGSPDGGHCVGEQVFC